MAHFTVSHSLERLSYTIRWKDLLLWIWPLSWLIGAAASKLGCQDILQNAACSWHRWQTEFEADHLSQLWTARAGYSTLEALNSFRSMMKSRDEGTIRLLEKEGSKGGQELIPKFLETHPWVRIHRHEPQTSPLTFIARWGKGFEEWSSWFLKSRNRRS